jgi:RNase P subunit RPR2
MEKGKPEEMTNRPYCQRCDQPLIPNPHRKDGEDAMRTTWWCNPCSLAQPRIEPITSILNASVTNPRG